MTQPKLVDPFLSKRHHEFEQTRNAVKKICRKCDNPILVGQKLHSKTGHNKGHSKHYHQECWDDLWI